MELAQEDPAILPEVAEEEVRPLFRAVSRQSERRGIRLEKLYWDALRNVADAGNATVAELVEQAALSFPDSRNLASLLRVISLKWYVSRVRQLDAVTALDNVNALIQASPSPAFALTTDKRILFYNQALLNMIQSRFLTVTAQTMSKGLRLALDMQVDQLIASLRQNQNKPVATGFALGVENQRIRGQINAVMAPTDVRTMVLAFISRI